MSYKRTKLGYESQRIRFICVFDHFACLFECNCRVWHNRIQQSNAVHWHHGLLTACMLFFLFTFSHFLSLYSSSSKPSHRTHRVHFRSVRMWYGWMDRMYSGTNWEIGREKASIWSLGCVAFVRSRTQYTPFEHSTAEQKRAERKRDWPIEWEYECTSGWYVWVCFKRGAQKTA